MSHGSIPYAGFSPTTFFCDHGEAEVVDMKKGGDVPFARGFMSHGSIPYAGFSPTTFFCDHGEVEVVDMKKGRANGHPVE